MWKKSLIFSIILAVVLGHEHQDDPEYRCKKCIDLLTIISNSKAADLIFCNVEFTAADCKKSRRLIEHYSDILGPETTCSMAHACPPTQISRRLEISMKTGRFFDILFGKPSAAFDMLTETTNVLGGAASGTVELANGVVQTAAGVLSDTMNKVPLAGGLLSGVIKGTANTVNGVAGGISSILQGATKGVGDFFSGLGSTSSSFFGKR